MLGRNGVDPLLMNFHEACKLGLVEIVKLYMECNQPANEEYMGRYDSDALTPLALASQGNHHEVVSLLVEHRGDPTMLDRRGRTPLHHAAKNGATECCAVLMDHGAKLFAGDHMGNTPMHFAAIGNFVKTVDFLSYKGQEFSRSIVTDKVLCQKGGSFQLLVEKVFERMQQIKLSSADTLRFEKDWVNDASAVLNEMMDSDRHMLAPSCEGIAVDIVERFDPRPETGVYVLKSVGDDNEQMFIPTIPSPHELGIILKYVFKQSALDNVNRLGKSALHVACDANKINSHDEVVSIMINKHGCNVMLQDSYRRTPIEYMMMDKSYHNAPTSTVEREETFFNHREKQLVEISRIYSEQVRAETAKRRQVILNDCTKRAYSLSPEVWEATRCASHQRASYGAEGSELGLWEYMEDPDTLNNFFCKRPVDLSESDKYTDFDWGIPDQVRSIVNKTAAFVFYRHNRCKLIRTIGRWEMYTCQRTKCSFYYDPDVEEVRFNIPKECRFRQLVKYAEVKRKLGFGNEWLEMIDTKSGHVFYKNSNTLDCVWDKPYEAVEITPNERFCTAFQVHNR